MRVMVVDDDATLRLLMRSTLESLNHEVLEAADGVEALELLDSQGFDLDAVILDVNMPRLNGIQTLEEIKLRSPRTFCLVMTAYSDVKDAVAAIKIGAFDYLEKPVDAQKLIRLFESANKANKLVEIAALSAPSVKFDEGRTIIGGSTSIRRVFDVIYKLAKVDTSVLVRGESGTGKELVARAIHYNSHRKKGPFIAVNCAAIPENLIESELFGHEKGSFTGAERKKLGKFQFAESGTLFLDEIGDISPSLQVKLLRALQEKSVMPVGSNQEIKVNVRIVAATNRPLEQMIEKEQFRADLFYRLNVLPITLPPLRDRREDIEPLIEFMIDKFNDEHKRQVTGFSPTALERMRTYEWPGNIRELENVVERAFILENGTVISDESLPENLIKIEKSGVSSTQSIPLHGVNVTRSPVTEHENSGSKDEALNFHRLKEEFERDFLIKALSTYKGRVNQTAEHTKMTKVTLLRKLEKYGIDARQYR